MTNNTTLAPASTAFFVATVEKQTKIAISVTGAGRQTHSQTEREKARRAERKPDGQIESQQTDRLTGRQPARQT